MNLAYKTKWDDLPFSTKVALVESRREQREQNPDPYQESLNAFRTEERARKSRVKYHVAKIMELRHA